MTPEMSTQSSDTSSEGARLAMSLWEPLSQPSLTPSQIQDLRLAASKMTGAPRRAFQAEMTLQYCRGSARLAATIVGWSRAAVEVGLAEHRTGMLCLGAPLPAVGANAGRSMLRRRPRRCDSWPKRTRSMPRRFARHSRLRASRRRPLGQRCGRKGSPRSTCPHPAPWRRW